MNNSEKILAMYDSLRLEAFITFGRKWHVFELTGNDDNDAKSKAIVTLEMELQSLDYQKSAILDAMDDKHFGNDEEGQHGRSTSKSPF